MWSKDHSCCIVCGTTERKYMGKGKCSVCYLAEYRADPKNAAKSRKSKHEWYLASGGKHYAKINRERRHFESKREEVLTRDGFKCVLCSATTKLTVHHIDGNGRGSLNPNNNLENLQTLCRACHARTHGTIDRWAKNHDNCLECGTTDIAHNARGYCRLCYSKLHRRHKI